jgi:predicted murein hydrolase (TIGR00659 family)
MNAPTTINTGLSSLWVYLAASPLLSLTITLLTFQVCVWLNKKLGKSALLHPVLLSIAVLITFLKLADISYDTYFKGAQFVHFLLGTATVALAVPLYHHLDWVKRMFLPLMIACFTGAATAALSTIAVGISMGASRETIISLAPKSVTSPIAMGISEKLGGLPALTAGLVLITGAIGCLIALPLYRLLNIRHDSVKGFALGLSAHGFGTAYAFDISQLAGAFAGLAIGLTGIVSAFLLPLLLKMLGI